MMDVMDTEKILNIVIQSIILIILLAGCGYFLSIKEPHWPVCKKQYRLLAVLIICVCVCLLVLMFFKPEFDNTILVSVLTGLIASVIYGVINIGNNHMFVETVSQKVAGLLDGSMPYKVYPESKKSERPFKEDLIESLKLTEKFYYFGIRMTVIVDCLEKVFSQDNVKLNTLFFYIPIPENELLSAVDLERLKESLNKLKIIFIDCENKYKHDHVVELNISLLNFYPPFHIHQTDNSSWFAAVKLYKETTPYPPTYLYKIDESATRNNGSSSMFDTIKRMVEVTGKNAIEDYKKTIPMGDGDNAREREKALLENSKDLFSFLVGRIDQQIEKKKT